MLRVFKVLQTFPLPEPSVSQLTAPETLAPDLGYSQGWFRYLASGVLPMLQSVRSSQGRQPSTCRSAVHSFGSCKRLFAEDPLLFRVAVGTGEGRSRRATFLFHSLSSLHSGLWLEKLCVFKEKFPQDNDSLQFLAGPGVSHVCVTQQN